MTRSFIGATRRRPSQSRMLADILAIVPLAEKNAREVEAAKRAEREAAAARDPITEPAE